ncbi:hypothetical protein BLS_002392 [Venturia inaequalis]|uniref:CFEM domain-containing protein n=1 Tax=Venturia inaequalis TaxID=5025 RepID=A0A8H3VT58_VENIN|nr:hypothetical protein BLS_002392 [Venturia inaequalis]KAE9993328.1 hypothetical protein EG327_005522 [Venturia inaequalis]RDI88534.1 hypothetical protein Vi05172_g1130 [Venturia inaequalis]
MKYNLALLSVLGLNFGLTFAQDAQTLVAVGFPACAVQCVQSGNKAAADKHGCGLTDGVCQCTTGFKTAQETVMNCIMSTKTCTDADMAKIATAGANLCSISKQSAPHSSANTTSSSNSTHSASGTHDHSANSTHSGEGTHSTGTSTTKTSAAVASASVSGTPGKPANGTTSSANAAGLERTFVVGALGLVGAVVAFAL